MKVMIVSEDPEIKTLLKEKHGEAGWEFIQYFSPIKAMDNIDEIEPDAVLFSAMDFPRHWKTFLTYLRHTRDKRQTVFILQKGLQFPVEEASKAAFLGTNGLIEARLDEETLKQVQHIIRRYNQLSSIPLKPEVHTRDTALMFTHPVSGRLISGSIQEHDDASLEFFPDAESGLPELSEGQRISHASLRRGHDILTVDLTVEKVQQAIHFAVTGQEGVGRSAIKVYISSESGK